MARKATPKSGQKKKPPASSARKRTSGKSSKGRAAPSKGAGARKKAPAKKKATAKKPVSKRPAGRQTSRKKAPARKPSSKKTTKRPVRGTSKAAAPAKTRKPVRRRGKGRPDAALLLGHTHDDLYAARLIEELEFRHGIDVSTIDIGIRDGKARVRGVVSDEDELDAVRDTIAEGGGISDLEYLVQIGPSRREADRDQAQDIQDVLDGEPDLQAENIQVACLNRKIILRGTVSNPMHKVKAGLLALRQDNVQRIRNRLVVAK